MGKPASQPIKIHRFDKDALFTIMDLGSLIHSSEDLGKVLHFLVEKVAGLMKADACSLYLYDVPSKSLTLKAVHGLNSDCVDHITIQEGQGLTGNTIKHLRPISIANAKRSKNYLTVDELSEDQYASYLSVPLIYNGNPIGVISVQTRKATKFAQKDIDFLLTLSIPAVSLIEKAKFMGTVQSMQDSTPKEPHPQDKTGDVKIQYLKDHFLRGIAAVPGIAMGRLKIVDNKLERRNDLPEQVNFKQETLLLKEAFVHVSQEIQETKKQAEAKFGPDEASIFEAYLLFLESTNFQQQIIDEIKNGLPAVHALDRVVGKYMDRMSLANDEYIKERAYDIQDVARKISDHLLYGKTANKDKFASKEDTIFCNEFWSISDFVNLDLKRTKGIISPTGGASSHISILADTLNLPSVLGLGTASSQLKDGDLVIVDGFSGTVIVNPTPRTIKIYKAELSELEKRRKLFHTKKDQKVRVGLKTKRTFPVGANLGMVAHVKNALESGADQVGLYRTEFPFLVRKTLPTEEEQYIIYKRALELMKGKEIVYRTLDIGGDKYVSYLNLPDEGNPALGWRAIRFSLERKDLFRIQLRALLRASAHGKMKILLPMITGVEQVRESKEILDSVKRELTDQKIKFTKNIPLGVMIEVPSAVEVADKLAKEVDFFSLGTNDLVQYCLAVDRTNPLVANLYDPFHPAVLKLIRRSIKSAHKADIKISLCGDMAGQPLLATLLLGLGVDSLSMIPRSVPKIKHLLRRLSEDKAHQLALRCLKMDTGSDIRQEVEGHFKEWGLEDEFALKGRAPLTEL